MTDTTTDSNVYLSVRTDRLFKTVFANPDDTRLMNAVLSEALGEPVEVLEFFPTELAVRNKKERVKVLDVLLQTKDGNFLNCEVNTSFDLATRVRNLAYFTSFYSQKVQRGEEYDTKSDFIHIDFDFNKNESEGKKKIYRLLDEETLTPYVDHFKMITINIENVKKEWYDKNIQGDKENIHLVMLGASEEELVELSKKDELVKEFDQKMYILNSDGTFIRTVSEEEDKERLTNTRISLAKEEAAEEATNNRNIEIAKSMLEKKYDIQEIMDLTGLSITEIEKLKEENRN